MTLAAPAETTRHPDAPPTGAPADAPGDVGPGAPARAPDGVARCPVTVVGARRRIDLALPLDAPIGQYVGRLVDACAQPVDETLPQVWSLAPLIGRAYPLDVTLRDVGVLEGAVLHLRDLAAGEGDEPAAVDIDEVVADATESLRRLRWDQRAAALTSIVAGAGWLVGTGVFLRPGAGRPVAAPACAGAAVLLLLLGAVMSRRAWPVPPAVPVTLALGATPLLAAAAWQVSGARRDVVLAVHVGVLLALASVPCLATAAVALWTTVGTLVTAALMLLHATPVHAAEVVAVVAYGLQVGAPFAASRLALMRRAEGPATAPAGATAADAGVLVAAVHRAHRTLSWWAVAAGVLQGTALVLLARSDHGYAWVVVGSLALASTLRSVSLPYWSEAVAALGAASAGLVALTVSAPTHPAWTGAAAGLGTGVALLAVGCWLVRRSPFPDRRRPWLNGVVLAAVIGAVLALLADWGVMTRLFDLGTALA